MNINLDIISMCTIQILIKISTIVNEHYLDNNQDIVSRLF
jgi:hypothetical protein